MQLSEMQLLGNFSSAQLWMYYLYKLEKIKNTFVLEICHIRSPTEAFVSIIWIIWIIIIKQIYSLFFVAAAWLKSDKCDLSR